MADRREVLRATAGALGVSLGGCMGAPRSPRASSVPFAVPSPEECVRTDRPTPDPVAGYEPRPYPDPPDEFDGTASEEFALAYERAVTYNDWLVNNVSEETESFSVEVTVGATAEASEGHLVGLDWSASDTNDEGAIGEAWGATVYYIAPRVGVRAYPDAESVRDVSLQSCDCTVLGTVYCR